MAERFEIQDEVQILQNDPDLNSAFAAAGFALVPHYLSGDTSPAFFGDTWQGNYYLTKYGYNALANFYFSNLSGKNFGSDTFLAVGVAALAANANLTESIWSIIDDPRSTPNGTPPNFSITNSSLAMWLFYAYKYSAIKMFFVKNINYFLPEYDLSQVSSSDELELFYKSFMREYDRFSRIIDEIHDIIDIDRIPTAYLQYLGQLLGYERTDYQLLTDSSFRELLKNILEIYAIKGTNYSFQLFFNLLGYSITPQEFWFDRRFADSGITSNPYTFSTDKTSYLYYLTPNDPTTTIPTGMHFPYSVTADQITAPKDLQLFNTFTNWYTKGDSRGYPPLLLTGNFTPSLGFGIRGDWPVYEGSGTSVIDLSINRNNLVLNDVPWTINGNNNGYQLNFVSRGDTKFATTANPINFSAQNAISISFWAKKTGGDSAVVWSFGLTGVDGFKTVSNINGGGVIYFYEPNSVIESVGIPNGVFDNKLRNYVFTYGAKQVLLYKNSVLVVNSSISGNPVFPNRKFVLGNTINASAYGINSRGIGALIKSSWLRDDAPRDMVSLYLDNRTTGTSANPILSDWIFGTINISDNPVPSNGWLGTYDQIKLYNRVLHPYEVKLLFSPIPAGDSYFYFKTNVIQYSISTLAGTPASLTATQVNSFNFYVNFLTPINITPIQSFQALPSLDSADTTGWFLLDANRSDPVYQNRGSVSNAINRYFAIQSINVAAGDTWHPRGQIVVSDPAQNLINYIHPSFTPPTGWQGSFINPIHPGKSIVTEVVPHVQVTSDSNILKRVLDSITIVGTAATSNDGVYTLASDTTSPFYNAATKQTTLFVKGDSLTGMHGTSKGVGGYLYIGGPQTMGHTYSGYYPDRWYWEQYNRFEASRTIPGNATLFNLYKPAPLTMDNVPPVRNSSLVFEALYIGKTTVKPNTKVKFPGYGITGFWRKLFNNFRTGKTGDTSKWNVIAAFNTKYTQIYDSTIGDSVFKWQPGTDIWKTIIGDTQASPDRNGIGTYYISAWIWGDTLLGSIKVKPYFSKAGGDTLFGSVTLLSAGSWNYFNIPITTITAHHSYTGVGLWIASGTRNLNVGDTFKVYHPQVEFADSLYPRTFIDPINSRVGKGDSLSYQLTWGDSGWFECWIRPYFTYNTVMDKYVFSDHAAVSGDSQTRINLRYNSTTDKWTFYLGATGNYVSVSSNSAYATNASLQQWTHIKATWIKTPTLVEFYVNGVPQHGDSSFAGTIGLNGPGIDRGDCESTTPPMVTSYTSPLLEGATFARSADRSHAGSYSYKMTKTSAGGSQATVLLTPNQLSNKLYGFIPGNNYTLTLYVYILSSSGWSSASNFSFGADQYYGGTWHYGFASASTNTYNSWVPLTIKFTVNSGATGFDLDFFIATAENAGVVLYFDDIVLTNNSAFVKGNYISIGTTPYMSVNYAFDGYISDALLGNFFSRTTDHYSNGLPYIQAVNTLGIPGSHISGFYIDTFSAYYDPTNPKSAFSTIKAANPNWSDEQAYALMNTSLSKAGDTGLYSPYGVKPRDIYLLVDSQRNMKQGYYSGTAFAGDLSTYIADSWVIYKRYSPSTALPTYSKSYRGIGSSIESSWLRDDNASRAVFGMLNGLRTVTAPINAILSDWIFGSYTSAPVADSRVFWRHGGFEVGVSRLGESGDTGNSITLGANWPMRVWDQRPQERFYQNSNTLNYTSADTGAHIADGMIFSIINNVTANTSMILVLDNSLTLPGTGSARGIGASIRSSWLRDDAPKDMISLYLDNRTIATPTSAFLSNWIFGTGTSPTSLSKFKRLTRSDYITLEGVQDDLNKTTRKVSSISWGGSSGDTLAITVTPVLPGQNQTYPQGYIYFESIRKVQKMINNNGSGFGQINVFDSSRLLTGLRLGDTIQLNNTGDSQVSVLYTVDSVGHYRLGVGDSGISVILTTAPLRKSGDSKGTVRLYGGTWGVNYPLYTFMNESFSGVKVKW